MTAGAVGGANTRSPRPDVMCTYAFLRPPSGETMRSSLSASVPGRWHAASLDILIGRRGGGAPSKTTRPSITALPIDCSAGMAPGGGAGGSPGSWAHPKRARRHDRIATGNAARPLRSDGMSEASNPRKAFTLVNSPSAVNTPSGRAGDAAVHLAQDPQRQPRLVALDRLDEEPARAHHGLHVEVETAAVRQEPLYGREQSLPAGQGRVFGETVLQEEQATARHQDAADFAQGVRKGIEAAESPVGDHRVEHPWPERHRLGDAAHEAHRKRGEGQCAPRAADHARVRLEGDHLAHLRSGVLGERSAETESDFEHPAGGESQDLPPLLAIHGQAHDLRHEPLQGSFGVRSHETPRGSPGPETAL